MTLKWITYMWLREILVLPRYIRFPLGMFLLKSMSVAKRTWLGIIFLILTKDIHLHCISINIIIGCLMVKKEKSFYDKGMFFTGESPDISEVLQAFAKDVCFFSSLCWVNWWAVPFLPVRNNLEVKLHLLVSDFLIPIPYLVCSVFFLERRPNEDMLKSCNIYSVVAVIRVFS